MDWKKAEEDESLLRIFPAQTGIRRQRGEDVRNRFHFLNAFIPASYCVNNMHACPFDVYRFYQEIQLGLSV